MQEKYFDCYIYKDMGKKKTRVADFIKYIQDNGLATERLLNRLKLHFLDYNYSEDDFIEDITDKDFINLRCVGKKSLDEFKNLRTNYLQYIHTRI